MAILPDLSRPSHEDYRRMALERHAATVREANRKKREQRQINAALWAYIRILDHKTYKVVRDGYVARVVRRED